jgi:hypothetical protein
VAAINDSHNGGRDVFLQKILQDDSSVEFSTYLGGIENEEPRAMAIDEWGCIYICGGTDSDDYPLASASDDIINGEHLPNVYIDCFVSKIDVDRSRLLFSSYLGGVSNEDPESLVLDDDGNLVICGMTKSSDFSVTSNAYQNSFFPGEWDAFLVVLYDRGDMDGDNLLEYQETLRGTNRTNNDTDFDQIPDGYEVLNGMNPLVDDSFQDIDTDGLLNLDEYLIGTNPNNRDSDGDTISDGWEVANGYDPLDANVPIPELIVYNASIIALVAIIAVTIPTLYFLRPKRKKKARTEIREKGYDQDETRSALEALSKDLPNGEDEEIELDPSGEDGVSGVDTE